MFELVCDCVDDLRVLTSKFILTAAVESSAESGEEECDRKRKVRLTHRHARLRKGFLKF